MHDDAGRHTLEQLFGCLAIRCLTAGQQKGQRPTAAWSGRGSSSSARRASGRWPGSAPPFTAARTAVRLDRRAVEQEVGRRPAGRRQHLEQIAPDAFRGPADEAVVQCLAWTVRGRGVPSAASSTSSPGTGAPGSSKPPQPPDPQRPAAFGGWLRGDGTLR
jgi:hypothetical protein